MESDRNITITWTYEPSYIVAVHTHQRERERVGACSCLSYVVYVASSKSKHLLVLWARFRFSIYGVLFDQSIMIVDCLELGFFEWYETGYHQLFVNGLRMLLGGISRLEMPEQQRKEGWPGSVHQFETSTPTKRRGSTHARSANVMSYAVPHNLVRNNHVQIKVQINL